MPIISWADLQNFPHIPGTAVLKDYIHPDDAEEEYVRANNQYAAYYWYAALKRPKAILEIGVRRGYSILAMCRGHKPDRVFLIDSEYDGCPLFDVSGKLASIDVNCLTFQEDSKTAFERIAVHENLRPYDIIHIDGEHTVDALRADLRYSKFLAPDGWIIVDDVKDMPELMEACKEFAEPEWDLQYVDTFRGHAVMRRAVEDRCVMNGGSD